MKNIIKKLKDFKIKKVVPVSSICPLSDREYYKDIKIEMNLKDLVKYHLSWGISIGLVLTIFITGLKQF